MNGNGHTPWKLFEESCDKYEHKNMVIHNNVEFTYGQVYDKVQEFCNLIKDSRSRIIGVYLPNSVEFIACMLAISRVRKVIASLSYQLKGESLLERINYSDIELVITDAKGHKEISGIQNSIGINELIVLQDVGLFEKYKFSPVKKEVSGVEDDTFGICFVSRKTAKHLGVIISNNAITANALESARFLGFGSEDVILAVRSFAIADPIVGDILVPINCGACIVIFNDLFHPAVLLKTLQDYKITTVLMVGTMLALMLEYPQIDSFDLCNLRRIIFASITTPREIVDRLIQKMQEVDLYCIYGIPEVPARVTYLGHPEILRFPGSVGNALRGYEVKIIREGGGEARPGEEGTIHIVSDYLMDGYYKSEQLSSEVFTENGLLTRDTGYKNEEGFLYLTGRNDDMIMQGGYEVYPIEIEELLLKSGYVNAATVCGVKDGKLGQKVVAVVSIVQGSNIGLQDLFKWCRANMEEKKVPKEIRFV